MIKSGKFKILLICCLFLSCIGLGVTLAISQSATNVVKNTFSVGSVESEIKEDVSISGGVINKDPKVVNTGENAALVRVKLTVSPEDMIVVNNNPKSLKGNININPDWYYKDGYYYYQKILPAEGDDVTTPLFKEITGVVDENGKFLTRKEPFEVTISQESIQIFALDESGTKVGFNSETDTYNQATADQVWAVFESKN